MKKFSFIKKGVALLLAAAMVITVAQPAQAATLKTKEKKVTVSFTKTKSKGFKKTTDISVFDNYVVALGTKEAGNTLSYSSDGMNFKDINLDSSIKKEYGSTDFSSLKLASYMNYNNDNKLIYIMGTGVTADSTTNHFVITVTKDMKKVKVEKLDDTIQKLADDMTQVNVDSYCNTRKDAVIINGSYKTSASDQEVDFYLFSKKGSEFTASENPVSPYSSVDFVGKYLVCASWSMQLNDAGKGEFYYSTDYKNWKKAVTPSVKGAVMWQRAYFDWDSFNVSPENYSSNTGSVYYTSNMKDFKSISKKYVIKGKDIHLDFDRGNKEIYAKENSYENGQVVLSKSINNGKKWSILVNYTPKNKDNFSFSNEYWIGKGLAFLHDGSTNMMIHYSNGKKYKTSMDLSKFYTYGSDNGLIYGVYKDQYLIASKNEMITNYLFKAPGTINGMAMSYSKKFSDRIYICSDNAIYYVNQSTLKKRTK